MKLMAACTSTWHWLVPGAHGGPSTKAPREEARAKSEEREACTWLPDHVPAARAAPGGDEGKETTAEK